MALPDIITQALAPGIALTSVIFYNSSLQNRFIYITGRVRDLNREARALRAEDFVRHRERLHSLRMQVDLMSRRSLVIRRAVLLVYGAFVNFIVTALVLLAAGVLSRTSVVPVLTFALGLLLVAAAAVLSIGEMYLSHRTLLEDTRISFGEPEPPR